MSRSNMRIHELPESSKQYRPGFMRTATLALRLRPLLVVAALGVGTPAMAQPAETDEPITPAVASPAAMTNPAIRATLARPRTTPDDYLRATLNLLDLGEPGLAGNVFRELVALEIDDAAKAKLVGEFGPAALLRLTRAPLLGADTAAFVDSAMAAAAAQAVSDERIAALVEQLASDSAATRQSAVASLAGIGDAAVVPLIQLLAADTATDEARQGARAALVRLGPLAERPLLATLSTGNARLVAESAELLAAIGSANAAPLLAVPALQGGSASKAYESLTHQLPSIESATGLLERTLKNLEGGAPVFEPDANGMVNYWVWSGKPVDSSKPVPLTLSVAEANTLYRSRLVNQLAQLRAGIPSLESKAMRLTMETVAILGSHNFSVGYPKGDVEQLSADALDRMLRDAMQENQVAAATIALQVIAERRDPGVLVTGNGQPSPTAAALVHPHPAVRAAALAAIAAIDSPTPFPGASKVCPTIVQLVTAKGKREVLAGAPRLDAATTWAGGLATMGFSGQVAATGGDLLQLGQNQADVELIFIDMAIGRPAVRDVVFQLRRQPTTALVPIALFAREAQLHIAQQIAFEHQRVLAFPRPHSGEALALVANDLLAQQPRNWPTAQQRLDEADKAIAVMNQLLGANRNYYRLRAASRSIAHSVRPDTASEQTWQLLAKLGTRESQVALLGYASAPALDIKSRRAAGEAFDQSVQRFGIRLLSSEITRQYDLYNASETDTKEVQQVLGAVLDSIESNRKKTNVVPK